jgi:tRNA(fMet)-specific endonuclease VapC
MNSLLDTNICIALIRQKSPQLIKRLISLKPGEVGISSITLAELEYGVEKSSFREQNTRALEQFLLPLEILPFDEKAANIYGKIRSDLERTGQTVGPMDLLIAAHALSLQATLVTNNLRKFERVEGLKVEDWISES